MSQNQTEKHFGYMGILKKKNYFFTERIDSTEVEDYLAEILSNEFNIIIEDHSLPKVH